MNLLKQVYQHSLSLLTDLYQLTMAYGYWKAGKATSEAVFTLFFRKSPFAGGYAIAAGLTTVVEYLEDLHFTESDLNYLATLTGADGKSLFEQAFLDYLGQLHFDCHLDAIPEGSLVFPYEPLLRVQGPLLTCQLLETALLNIINFQTLIATKATRVCQAAAGAPILEFGLRRAQGIDGALTASRAAYLGGCAGTSNVLAGKLYGIPVRGTHAHSWVMSFDSEAEAFQTYAEAMPNNCIFLVDTFDTLKGIKQAITTAHWLQAQGHQLLGIRLDSGDLVALSQQARQLLNAAGLSAARIVASNDLDEYLISQLRADGAAIDIWGVGTKLITSYDQPALGGVYKLTALRNSAGHWQYRLKLSDDPIKISTPGLLQVRRFMGTTGPGPSLFLSDLLFDELRPLQNPITLIDTHGHTITLPVDMPGQDLLVPILRQGQLVTSLPTLQQIRQQVQTQLALCPPAIKRFDHPETYPVNIEINLHLLKQRLIDQAQSGVSNCGLIND